MNPSSPTVSVILPIFNAAAYLPEALHSVCAQTFTAWELIAVDDGSTDGSAAVLRGWPDPRLRWTRQPHQGAAAARNAGLLRARAPYVAFLDADDVWLPDKLAAQVAALAADPALALVFGHYQNFGAGGEQPAAPGYSSGTLLARRSAFLKVGLFATRWPVGEFIDWYARAEEAGLASAMQPPVVLRRRVHAHNLTRGPRQAYAAVLAAMVRRRRAALAA
jgi:glycosyltransferase involved in cell wall biosynthesis